MCIRDRILSEKKEKWWTVKECFFEIDNLRDKYSDQNDEEKLKLLVLISGSGKLKFISFEGNDGFLKKLSCQQRAMDHPGHTLVAKGSVVNRFIGEDGLGYIECDIYIENQEGVITAPGKATVVLPTNENPNVPESFELPKSLN